MRAQVLCYGTELKIFRTTKLTKDIRVCLASRVSTNIVNFENYFFVVFWQHLGRDFKKIINKLEFFKSTQKCLLKNVQDGISIPIGS